MNKLWMKWAGAPLLAVMLAGCGGGSGEEETPATPETEGSPADEDDFQSDGNSKEETFDTDGGGGFTPEEENTEDRGVDDTEETENEGEKEEIE